MERKGGSMVAILVVVMVANCVSGQSIYACWGGCYNQCFLSSGGVQAERFPCYYLCLNSCVPRSAADYQYYCQIGCSLQICIDCIPASSDGAAMEECFGRCSNLCNV